MIYSIRVVEVLEWPLKCEYDRLISDSWACGFRHAFACNSSVLTKTCNLTGFKLSLTGVLQLKYPDQCRAAPKRSKSSKFFELFFFAPQAYCFYFLLPFLCIVSKAPLTVHVRRNTYRSYQSLPWGTSPELLWGVPWWLFCMAKMRYFRATGIFCNWKWIKWFRRLFKKNKDAIDHAPPIFLWAPVRLRLFTSIHCIDEVVCSDIPWDS
jgi:hypothetical protein